MLDRSIFGIYQGRCHEGDIKKNCLLVSTITISICDCLNIRFAIQLFNLVWYMHVLLLTQNADATIALPELSHC